MSLSSISPLSLQHYLIKKLATFCIKPKPKKITPLPTDAVCPDLLSPLPHEHFKYSAAEAELNAVPKALSGAEVTLGSSMEDALRTRERIRYAQERSFWASGRVAGFHTDTEAKRAGAVRQQKA